MMKISLDEKRKILVVDDEKINRDILENILKDEYDIICASNGLDALNIIKNEDNISLILLDLLMPVMTGLEFLHEIKKYENNKNIPIIVITFSSEAEEECLNLGAVDFLPKPYPKPGIIKARVKRTIELFEDRLIIKSTERDHLTNLYNPMYFYQYVLKLDEYYKNTNMDAVIIDIRHFHMINDRFGFNYGDNVLKDLAKKIKLKLKDIGGIVSRMDKDIFMVYLLHQESYDDFILNIKLDNNISIRIGVYENVDKTLEPSIRFDMAKIACNQIRNNMSKSVCYYDISLREKELFEERLINDFDKFFDMVN